MWCLVLAYRPRVVNDAFRTINVLNASFTTFTVAWPSPRRRNDTHSDLGRSYAPMVEASMTKR